jgi:c(7)-type cytochrome triheme protein
MRKIVSFTLLALLLLVRAVPAAQRHISPPNYGLVIIDNFSGKAGLAPVRFDHWLHRAIYTCRLCHVDIGFAMEANGTKITAEANSKGFYCGACHDGTRIYDNEKIFASCTAAPVKPGAAKPKRCKQCHFVGIKDAEKQQYDYATFTEKFPKRKYGKLIDWEKAESERLIKPVDFLEGVSFQRRALQAQKDFSITSRSTWMTDIIFSHKKHVVWNGCEVCHPDIFPSVKKGAVKYTMLEIAGGLYCGVCHSRVAFPLDDCDRCHIKPVGQ